MRATGSGDSGISGSGVSPPGVHIGEAVPNSGLGATLTAACSSKGCLCCSKNVCSFLGMKSRQSRSWLYLTGMAEQGGGVSQKMALLSEMIA